MRVVKYSKRDGERGHVYKRYWENRVPKWAHEGT